MPLPTLTCRKCTYVFAFPAEASAFECPSCGTMHARPRFHGEALDALHRAHMQLAACRFQDAAGSYQYVLLHNNASHEAHWGLTLCRYGVSYVREPQTGRCMPTIAFLQRKPIYEDEDFAEAMALAPEDMQAHYRQDAAHIAAICRTCLPDEAPEIFICAKTLMPGSEQETPDHRRALALAERLRHAGRRVFVSSEQERRDAPAVCEALTAHALRTAQVMLVVCSRPDWLTSPWPGSEWSRFMPRLDEDNAGCRLIPLLYDGFTPAQLPPAFVYRQITCLQMDEPGADDKLRSLLSLPVRRPAAAVPAGAAGQAVIHCSVGKSAAMAFQNAGLPVYFNENPAGRIRNGETITLPVRQDGELRLYDARRIRITGKVPVRADRITEVSLHADLLGRLHFTVDSERPC